jgi:colanic acid/amylovoran biosynthesis glycosyltransferase
MESDHVHVDGRLDEASEPSQPLPPSVVEGAVHRLGVAKGPIGTLRAACGAPGSTLVLSADGAWRACEFASRSLDVSVDSGWQEVWDSGDLRRIRAALASFELPCEHCRGCAAFAADSGQFVLAPAVAEHPCVDGDPVAAAPSRLTLRLPTGGAIPAGQIQSLASLLPKLQSIALAFDAMDADRPEMEWLRARRESAPGLAVQLRLRSLPDVQALLAACEGLRVVSVEWTAERPDEKTFAALRRAADALQAKALVRFVLRPDNWFEFERVASTASRHGMSLEWRFVDFDGETPLLALGHEPLTVLKGIVASAWRRFQGAACPSAVTEAAYFRMVDGLRRLLEQRLQDAMARGAAAASDAAVSMRMPPLEHAWFTDAALGRWSAEAMLSVSHEPWFGAWLHGELREGRLSAAMPDNALLRLLCQKLTAEQWWPEGCEALAGLYRPVKARAQLVAADEAFAAQLDLQPFRGPWLRRLGIVGPARKRPFAIGKARAPKKGAVPDLTVLIPSYAHGAYIQEAIRSVLAQSYPSFRLLVVDDCSPDDTVEKARGIDDPRLEVRVNETNLGLGNSVLQALASVDTPYLALLNSDDLFHPERLARCRERLEQEPAIQLVTTAMSLVDGSGGQLTPGNVSMALDGRQVFDWVHWYDRENPRAEVPKEELFGALLERNFLATSSNFVARTDWLRSHAESLRSLKYCLDWQLFLDAARQQVHCHLPEPLVAYRLHPSNTVWFRGGRRWSFFMEANRVVAASLAAAVAEIQDPDARLSRLLDLVARHVLRNREADGVAMFVGAVAQSRDFDRSAAASPEARSALESLEAASARSLQLRDAAEADRRSGQRMDERLRSAFDSIARELLPAERARGDSLRGYVDSLERRLQDSYSDAQRVERDRSELAQRLSASDAQLVEARRTEASARTLAADHAQRAESLRVDLEAARAQAATVAELWALLQQDLASAKAASEAAKAESQSWLEQAEQQRLRADGLQVHGEALTAQVADLQSQRDGLQSRADALASQRDDQQLRADSLQLRVEQQLREAEAASARLRAVESDLSSSRSSAEQAAQQLAATSSELESTRLALESSRQEVTRWRFEHDAWQALAEDLRAKLHVESTQHEVARASIQALERQRSDLRDEKRAALAKVDELSRSREYRIGNFFWNTLLLSYMSRRGKKWYNRILDAKDRFSLWLGAKFGKHKAEGVAVVASCWHWPIYSHTFVYQEMIGLTHMGLDVRMFHWADNDASELQPAFSYLANHRTQIKPVWENHFKDKEHFDKTKPGRLRELLQRISAVTGQSVEELEAHHHVIQACTFARMAELAGARYIHTYFFYDQTFMGMVASWLLGIPRGISCYADHMLDDFPFKLVGLQIELANVVVATSARIKQELSEKSGGKFDDRIIVKPNGVDGARFPIVERPARAPGDVFEVVSVSRIEPKKGLVHLAEAVAMLKKRGHKVVAHVIGAHDPHNKGSLEYLEELKARIAELGVQDQVLLLGMKMQEEIRPILQRSRAFVAPYVELATGDKDGIPTAMLEAMASQLPIVTTDSGSILEVVDDGVEGIVVAQRDSAAFAAALEKLIKDPALERKFSRAARSRFDRQFDIKVTERVFHAKVASLLAAQSPAEPASKPAEKA